MAASAERRNARAERRRLVRWSRALGSPLRRRDQAKKSAPDLAEELSIPDYLVTNPPTRRPASVAPGSVETAPPPAEMTAKAAQWRDQLNAEEAAAVAAYCGGADQRTDGALATGREPVITRPLDSALRKATLHAEPFTCYRSVFITSGVGQTTAVAAARQYPCGATIDIPGYLPAVLNPDHVDLPDPANMALLVFRTERSAILDSASGTVLMPRHTRWRVADTSPSTHPDRPIPSVTLTPDDPPIVT